MIFWFIDIIIFCYYNILLSSYLNWKHKFKWGNLLNLYIGHKLKLVIKVAKSKTKLSEILELLDEKELTSKEISSELRIPKKNLWVYLNTLLKQNRIIRLNDKKPYIYRSINLEKLKEGYTQLYSLFKQLMDNSEQLIEDDDFFAQLIKENINLDLIIDVNSFLGLE